MLRVIRSKDVGGHRHMRISHKHPPSQCDYLGYFLVRNVANCRTRDDADGSAQNRAAQVRFLYNFGPLNLMCGTGSGLILGRILHWTFGAGDDERVSCAAGG